MADKLKSMIGNNFLFIFTRNIIALLLIASCCYQVVWLQKELDGNLMAMAMMALAVYFAKKSETD